MGGQSIQNMPTLGKFIIGHLIDMLNHAMTVVKLCNYGQTPVEFAKIGVFLQFCYDIMSKT